MYISVLVWLSLLILAAASGMFYLRYLERHALFYPTRPIEFLPTEIGLAFEDCSFKTPQGLVLHGWFVAAAQARYTVLYCHGNAGNISHRLERFKFFHELGLNIFMFDYRGYGRSAGSPSETGLYTDVLGAFRYLLGRGIKPGDIIGYGESLGGAVIIDLAHRQEIGALILDSAFSNARDMAREVYPFIPSGVFASRWNSTQKIQSITVPKLIIHSFNDEIVPFAQGRALYRAAGEPKEFLQVQGGHNSGFFESASLYRQTIARFIRQLQAHRQAVLSH